LDALANELSRLLSGLPISLPIGLGLLVELAAILLIPVVLLRRKEPSSTAAWILALIFLPVAGAALFWLFGRDRVRIPAQWKRDADRALASRRGEIEAGAAAHNRTRAEELEIDRAGVGVEAGADEARERGPRAAKERGSGSDTAGAIFRVASAFEGGEPTRGNEVELLVDGDATYDAIGAAIDAARVSVHAEYYLIRQGETADWFRDRLIEAARRGVKVRLLIDGYGSFWIGRRWLKPLRAAGVSAVIFLPARLLLFQPMNLRNHRKIVVVDNEVAFTGGVNIGDEYRGKSGPWRDMHVRVRGPAVARLAQIFAQDFHFAALREAPLEEAALGAGLGSAGGSDAARGATVAIVRSGPDVEGLSRETIHRLFFSAITTARSTICITTPYFVPDRTIVLALETAALRGVSVRLLLPGRNNHGFYALAGRCFYEGLLSAGVQIYEYGPGMIHAKTMVVDGAVAFVGSANMDLRSFRLNFEVHAVMSGAGVAQKLEGCFEEDIRASNPIRLEAFRRRSRSVRVAEAAARFLLPLM
jgi:cardiolipin synthase